MEKLKEEILNITKNIGEDFTEEEATVAIVDHIQNWLEKELGGLEVLRDEKIELIIRETYPVFELNEQGEEVRKQTTIQLLQAQLDDVKKHFEV